MKYRLGKKDLWCILIIFALGIILRFMYFIDYMHTDAYPLLQDSDGYSYFTWAKDIASGDFLGSKTFTKWPLYAYFLGAIFKFFGSNISLVYAIQFVLGSVNSVLIYLISGILFKSRRVGFIAALLNILYGLYIFYEGLLIYTNLSLFLNLLLFLFLLLIKNNLSRMRIFGLGLFLGVCTISQANIIIFGILSVVWILWQSKEKLVIAIKKFVCFLFGLVVILGAVTARNYLVEKEFAITAVGVQFYVFNNPTAGAVYTVPEFFSPNQEGMFRDARVIARVSTAGNLKTSEVSDFWFKKSVDFIKNNPAGYLRLLASKLIYLFGAKEHIQDPEYYLVADNIRIFRVIFLDLKFILPLCILGLLLNMRKFKESALLYIILASFSLSFLFFSIATRYRIAAVPFMTIFASSAVFSVWDSLKARKYLKLVLKCLFLISVYLLANYSPGACSTKSVRKNDNFISYRNHLEKALTYNNKLNYNSAMNELSAAYRIQPKSHYLLYLFGTVYFRTNNFKMAEEMFKEAIRIFPLFVDAYYNLGFLYNQQQRFNEAKQVLEKAVSLDPDDLGVHYELGRAYKAKGDFGKAKDEFDFVLARLNLWRTKEKKDLQNELNDLNR